MTAAFLATREALWEAGQLAVDKATPNVPVETGTLQRSARVTDELPNPDTTFQESQAGVDAKTLIGPAKGGLQPNEDEAIKMYVSYNTPYAAALHEGTNWKPRPEKKTATGKDAPSPAKGSRKWLENTLPAVRLELPRLLADKFKKAGF